MGLGSPVSGTVGAAVGGAEPSPAGAGGVDGGAGGGGTAARGGVNRTRPTARAVAGRLEGWATAAEQLSQITLLHW